jgi:tape measure domain-containing protein
MARGVELGRGYIAVDVEEGPARAALKGFASFAGTAFKAAAISAGALVGAAAKVGVEFLAMKESAQIAFATLLGSGEKAKTFLADLQTFAASTPFELPGLIDNARALLGVGIAAKDVIPIMRSLGDAAGALGLSQDQFNRIMLATTQAMGKGKLQGDELLQFVEAGIPVWKLLAKATGKPVPELQKLSEQGKLLSAEVLPLLFQQMSKDYGGAMAAQSQTLTGQLSSLKDNTKILLGTAFEPLFQTTKSVTGALNELAQSTQAQAFVARFADQLSKAIVTATNFAARVGPMVKSVFGDIGTIVDNLGGPIQEIASLLGGVLRAGLEAARNVLQALADNSDEFGSALSTAAAIARPVVQVLGDVLKALGVALSGVVHLVGALSGPIGVLTGVVLVGVVAWRTLSTAVTLASAAWTRFRPAAIAGSMSSLAQRIDNVALSAGVMAERVGLSADAATKVASVGGRVGRVATGLASSLPVVGIAAAAVGTVFGIVAERVEEANRKFRETHNAASAVEDAAQRVKVAQEVYNRAVAQFGENSDQAVSAQRSLTEVTEAERQAQADAANATKTHTQRLQDLQNQIIGQLDKQVAYNNAVLSTRDAQTRAAEAVAQHGAKSEQARFASDELSASFGRQINAAGELALANSRATTEEGRLTDQMAGATLEAIKLIDQLGNQAPPALYRMVAGLDRTALAALGGKVQVDAMGNAIIDVPGYKPIHIDSNMWAEAQNAAQLKRNVESIPRRWSVDVLLREIRQPAGPSSLGGLIMPGARASGGPVKTGRPYLVGEEGPELIFPNRSGYVATTRQTSALIGPSGGGVSVVQNITPGPDIDAGRIADLAAQRLMFRLS